MNGWIKLHRKFEKWGWFHKSEMVHLFIYFLLEANHETRKFEKQTIRPGQLVTGRNKIQADTGISEQTIRTCINRLKSTSEITIKSTNKYSIITLCNYNTYQDTISETNQQINQQTNQQLTNNQPATNHKQEYKNIKNERNKNKEFFADKSEKFQQAFGDYLAMRRKIKKPATDRAIELVMKKLESLSSNESIQIAILEQSIQNSWQGVFELKGQDNHPSEYKPWQSFPTFREFYQYYKPLYNKSVKYDCPKRLKDMTYSAIQEAVKGEIDWQKYEAEFEKLR